MRHIENPKACIIAVYNGLSRYFDKNGNELQAGDTVRYDNGRTEKLYRTAKGMLGTDATNPAWVASGRAVPCQYGIYPLETQEMAEIERISQ